MTDASRPPESCAVAFKEWAGVCEALDDGRQSLILRKGGIEEGPGGFAPEHPAFWLYPTRVHQAEQGLRVPARSPEAFGPEGNVILDALAVVSSVHFVDAVERLAALEPLHVWTEETVLKRFHYRRPGLWVLGVRVYRARHPHVIVATPEHAGCKTWVPLGEPLSTDGLVPAVDDDEHRRLLDRLESALGSAAETP